VAVRFWAILACDGCDTSLPLNSSWHACRSIEGSLVSVLRTLARGGLRIAR
jgi:hypothetical protein